MDKRDVLTAFMQAWQNQDYEQMFEFSQTRWKAGKNPGHIEALFSTVKLKAFTVFSDTYVSTCAHKYNIDLHLESGNRLMSVVNVICEDFDGKPVSYGTWGVNPHSVQNIVSAIPKKKPVKKQEK